MKKKLLTAAGALGLLLGGFAVGQFFSVNDIISISETKLEDLPATAYRLSTAASELGGSASAAQISQVNSEMNTRLQYIQIRQNAEIIRLLNVIAAKK